ncbi:MAG: hypothetical protein HKO07_02270, partial [Pseudomonadales bacterium]|nr:hypothetical protein [Pseudomonadales bacterium]
MPARNNNSKLSSSIPAIPASEITPEPIYRARRELIAGLSAAAAMAVLPAACAESQSTDAAAAAKPGKSSAPQPKLPSYQLATPAQESQGFYTEDELTPFSDAARYNNF